MNKKKKLVITAIIVSIGKLGKKGNNCHYVSSKEGVEGQKVAVPLSRMVYLEVYCQRLYFLRVIGRTST